MARRARDRRKTIPGYDEFRPRRSDRARDHRKVRHAANQMLHTAVDVEELAPLPEVRSDHHLERDVVEQPQPPGNSFAVGKSKFWKRRAQYKEFRAGLDANWPAPEVSEG